MLRRAGEPEGRDEKKTAHTHTQTWWLFGCLGFLRKVEIYPFGKKMAMMISVSDSMMFLEGSIYSNIYIIVYIWYPLVN